MKKLALAAVAAFFAAVTPASAITNGAPDGNRHPWVGALLAPQAFSDGTWEECSGTLIAPKVFLTAEHCDEGLSRVKVTFDSVYQAPGTTYTGTWHGDPPTRYTFAWVACNKHGGACKPVSDATKRTLKLGPNRLGRRFRVVVSVRAASGSASARSAATAVVRR